MSIVTQTKTMMRNAIMRYANENETANSKSQILICSEDAECIPSYKILADYKPQKSVTFSDLLNVKIDFLGREIIATLFIKNCIKRLTRENDCSPHDINVVIYGKDDDLKDINVYLFVKNKPIKPLTFDYIFGEDIQ